MIKDESPPKSNFSPLGGWVYASCCSEVLSGRGKKARRTWDVMVAMMGPLFSGVSESKGSGSMILPH